MPLRRGVFIGPPNGLAGDRLPPVGLVLNSSRLIRLAASTAWSSSGIPHSYRVSIQQYVLRLDDGRPSGTIGVDELLDGGSAARPLHRKAKPPEFVTKCIVVHGTIEAGADPGTDVVRQSSWHREAGPEADAIVGITALGDGRYVRQVR